jgi:cytochrome c
MGNIGNAARFIKANMPLGQGGKLFDQGTRNVAAYIDSHKRPQDPRFIGSSPRRARGFMIARCRCMAARSMACCLARIHRRQGRNNGSAVEND